MPLGTLLPPADFHTVRPPFLSPKQPAMGCFSLFPPWDPAQSLFCVPHTPRSWVPLPLHRRMKRLLPPSEITVNCSISVRKGRCMILAQISLFKENYRGTVLMLTVSRKLEVIWGQNLFVIKHTHTHISLKCEHLLQLGQFKSIQTC